MVQACLCLCCGVVWLGGYVFLSVAQFVFCYCAGVGPLRYARVRILAKAARSALSARDLSGLKGILADVLAERPRLYDNTPGHSSSGAAAAAATRSRLASAGSDASMDALAAIAQGQASTRAHRSNLRGSFQGQQVVLLQFVHSPQHIHAQLSELLSRKKYCRRGFCWQLRVF